MKNKVQNCRICKCTDSIPCRGECRWIEPSLCSKCARKLPSVTITSYVDGKKVVRVFRGDTGSAKDYLESLSPSPF